MTEENRTVKEWHPRVEMRWRASGYVVLEQLWQCPQTGELWWRMVPTVFGSEEKEP